ncbi:hypothetical protein [Corynebacterium sp. sy039]|uniref:hypothetical protein n=1 Tax=Corynebacterium sp. sy039 TaxID=2599641 RepID=UPI0011B85AE1|nr:hypothetical protein [Corynebacterium sp. sy039]QDZ41909.1 hypothetical protein FQV43_01040 [Corynebacterium sp. sy039]
MSKKTLNPGHVCGRSYVLPDSLEDMDGPTNGVVKLPNYLDWHTDDGFDLDEEEMIDTMYRTVLREALKVEDLRYLNHTLLRKIWRSIRIPPVL